MQREHSNIFYMWLLTCLMFLDIGYMGELLLWFFSYMNFQLHKASIRAISHQRFLWNKNALLVVHNFPHTPYKIFVAFWEANCQILYILLQNNCHDSSVIKKYNCWHSICFVTLAKDVNLSKKIFSGGQFFKSWQ